MVNGYAGYTVSERLPFVIPNTVRNPAPEKEKRFFAYALNDKKTVSRTQISQMARINANIPLLSFRTPPLVIPNIVRNLASEKERFFAYALNDKSGQFLHKFVKYLPVG